MFEKSGAIVTIIPGSEFKSKIYGKCVSVHKVPDKRGDQALALFVPVSALRKLTNEERGTFIHNELEQVLGN